MNCYRRNAFEKAKVRNVIQQLLRVQGSPGCVKCDCEVRTFVRVPLRRRVQSLVSRPHFGALETQAFHHGMMGIRCCKWRAHAQRHELASFHDRASHLLVAATRYVVAVHLAHGVDKPVSQRSMWRFNEF